VFHVEQFGVIYLVLNKINGKSYVGQTAQGLAERWRLHKKEAQRGSQFGIHRATNISGA